VRILVTGHAGLVGAHVAEHLEAAGFAVVGFDRADGDDIRDADALANAARGCEAVVHAAALAHDSAGTPSELFATNVTGTWNALAAAEGAGARVFIQFSSAQVFGIAEGEQQPQYFPIDDDHPRNATRPYGLSKCLGEDLCAAATRRSGMATIVLRPVAVWTESTYEHIAAERQRNASFEWSPFWEFGAFVDVRDVATAVERAVDRPPGTHDRLTLCAGDISATAPAREMAQRLMPNVVWRRRTSELYNSEPWRALFDTTRTRSTLGWEPAHTWAAWLAANASGGS
jgi:nucleoside-diphosphate-sugar epimerase